MAFRGEVLDDPISGERNGGFIFTRSRLMFAALAGLLALALSACGAGDASTAATAAATDGPTVAIEDLAFAPETLTVESGETVRWVWKDGAIAHDVTGDDFQSEVMSEGTFRHRFEEPGTYDYVCTLHPNMRGTIEVTR
jgi:plastocyanin